MKINDEGTSNAAHWHERAMKAEARLAELESDDKRMTWLIQNGERIFGSLWREASKRDIDAAMQAPDSAASQPRPLTAAERSALDRAFARSITVLDPGIDATGDQPTAYCRYCGVPDGDGHTADCQHPSLASQPSVMDVPCDKCGGTGYYVAPRPADNGSAG